MSKLLIGMLSYNRIEMTKRSLESLYANTNIEDFELVILDNGSDKVTTTTLMKFYKTMKLDGVDNIKLILLDGNIGVADGLNEIIKDRKPDQHFMKMDNDIVFKDGTNKDWIKKITSCFDLNIDDTMSNVNKIGAVSIKPYTWLENEQKEVNLIEEFPIVIIGGEEFQYNPEGVTGCSTVYNKEVMNELGNFDKYGLYGYEDSMFCTRMFLKGYLALYNNQIARVYHIDPGGETDYLKWKHGQATENFQKYFDSYTKHTEGKI